MKVSEVSEKQQMALAACAIIVSCSQVMKNPIHEDYAKVMSGVYQAWQILSMTGITATELKDLGIDLLKN